MSRKKNENDGESRQKLYCHQEKEGTNGFYSQFRLKIKATMEFISTVYMT